MRNLRVALCQLESHPAIYSGHVAFAEEPFVPLGDRWSLSRLGNKGIDVDTLQDYCKTELRLAKIGSEAPRCQCPSLVSQE
jgi:hypothetical protein